MVYSEADVTQATEAFYRLQANRVVASLNRRGLTAQYVADRSEALTKLLGMIPEGATVGRGDSVTLEEVGILSALRQRGRNEIFDPFLRDTNGNLLVTGPARFELMRKALISDIFLTGTNAVTMDGKLVSTDGRGNRVGAMLFGPRKVIVVAGANKIVNNVEEAIARVKNIAAPLNVQRHYLKHHMDVARVPCFHGVCTDCSGPVRACLFTVIIEGESAPSTVPDYLPRIHVIMVGERLGL